MLVKNLVSWAGQNFNYEPGELIEMPDAMAKARIKAGLAVESDGKPDLPVRKMHQAEPSTKAAAE